MTKREWINKLELMDCPDDTIVCIHFEVNTSSIDMDRESFGGGFYVPDDHNIELVDNTVYDYDSVLDDGRVINYLHKRFDNKCKNDPVIQIGFYIDN